MSAITDPLEIQNWMDACVYVSENEAWPKPLAWDHQTPKGIEMGKIFQNSSQLSSFLPIEIDWFWKFILFHSLQWHCFTGAATLTLKIGMKIEEFWKRAKNGLYWGQIGNVSTSKKGVFPDNPALSIDDCSPCCCSNRFVECTKSIHPFFFQFDFQYWISFIRAFGTFFEIPTNLNRQFSKNPPVL